MRASNAIATMQDAKVCRIKQEGKLRDTLAPFSDGMPSTIRKSLTRKIFCGDHGSLTAIDHYLICLQVSHNKLSKGK
jgi:hypothetical protein